MRRELMTEIIETERLVLFPYTSENLALFNKDLDLFEKTYDVHYCGEELDDQLRSFLVELQNEISDDPENYLFFTEFLIVLKTESVIIGSIDFKYIPRNGITEVGYGMNRAYEGCGYMTEALTAFLKFGKKLGIGTVRADTTKENTRSRNVLRRCGFSFIGEDQNMWWEKKLLID